MSKLKSADVAESHLYRVTLPLKYELKMPISVQLNPNRSRTRAQALWESEGKNCAMSKAHAVEWRPSSLDSATNEASVTSLL